MTMMSSWYGALLRVSLVAALAACGGGDSTPSAAVPLTTPSDPADPSPTSTARDIMGVAPFAPLARGTYFIDPDGDSSTPLRVVYTVADDGWSMWTGAVKLGDDGFVGISIVTVTNLVRHGCRGHAPADPPLGPGVDELAGGLASLRPFRVTAPPADITHDGHSGKHLMLSVPDLPVEARGQADRLGPERNRTTSFTGCADGNLQSWIAPEAVGGAFYGYWAPGQREEFWILDVDGTRLMIAATWTRGSSRQDLAELRAIRDSIRFES